MKASQLIEELGKLPPDEDIDEWLKARAKGSVITLNFEQAGRAIRAILASGAGKPDIAANQDQSGKKMLYRNLVWNTYNDIDRANKLAAALTSVGITEYRITPAGWFTLHIPYKAFASSFYYSDSVEDWQKSNEAMQLRVDEKKAKKIRSRNAHYAEWQANYERRQVVWQEKQKQMKIAEKAKLLEEAITERNTELSSSIQMVKDYARAVRQED